MDELDILKEQHHKAIDAYEKYECTYDGSTPYAVAEKSAFVYGYLEGYKQAMKDFLHEDEDDNYIVFDDNEEFNADFEEFKKDNPTWEKYLTDSTVFELRDWYDLRHGTYDEEDDNSEKAYDFAQYVWCHILGLKW